MTKLKFSWGGRPLEIRGRTIRAQARAQRRHLRGCAAPLCQNGKCEKKLFGTDTLSNRQKSRRGKNRGGSIFMSAKL